MIRQIPIGIDDFRVLREKNFEYVDKTCFITEFIDRESIKVILVPRPRRFGKSMNLTMLKWFFEKTDENLWHLFEGLHVEKAGEKYRKHFQKYPVIHVSFKETKAESVDGFRESTRRAIRRMYEVHRGALDGKLEGADLKDFQAILNDEATETVYRWSLQNLTRYLHQVHGTRPIVLIDEYDAGIHAGYLHGFYDDVVHFFASLFLAGLKDNPHLERAVMTGILRVSRESIFSELNNIGVYSLLRGEFNTCFGFTDEEVEALLERVELPEMMEPLRNFYNGYEFGGVDIYNPWSILSFLSNVNKQLIPYWVNTSSNLLIKELLQHHAFTVQEEIETLLAGGGIEKELDENVVFPDLKKDPSALWNLLVFSGYLKAQAGAPVFGEAPPPYRLSIPNKEIDKVYRTTFKAWMDEALTSQGGTLRALLDALLKGDVREFEYQLQKFATSLPSYHDVRGTSPETFYHGMMIGLLAGLEPDYEVRSNRESGEGRPDVLIKPRYAGKPGAVLELKSARKGETTIEKAMAEGLRQLGENDYAADLRAAGVEKIQQMVVAFDGKRVMVLPKGAKPPKKKSAVKKVGESIGKAAKKVVAKAKKATLKKR
ncbi:MAG: AAA family ATPase [Polyangiaceae bacterium]|nr:AAA family ATPase [Polyangiaceae bacterium]